MTTNELPLDATYKISDISGGIPQDAHPGTINYLQVISASLPLIKEHFGFIIRDGHSQIIAVGSNDVLFNKDVNHPRYKEHTKMYEELKKVWEEVHGKKVNETT